MKVGCAGSDRKREKGCIINSRGWAREFGRKREKRERRQERKKSDGPCCKI